MIGPSWGPFQTETTKMNTGFGRAGVHLEPGLDEATVFDEDKFKLGQSSGPREMELDPI